MRWHTHKHNQGTNNLETESPQWADSVKILPGDVLCCHLPEMTEMDLCIYFATQRVFCTIAHILNIRKAMCIKSQGISQKLQKKMFDQTIKKASGVALLVKYPPSDNSIRLQNRPICQTPLYISVNSHAIFKLKMYLFCTF